MEAAALQPPPMRMRACRAILYSLEVAEPRCGTRAVVVLRRRHVAKSCEQ